MSTGLQVQIEIVEAVQQVGVYENAGEGEVGAGYEGSAYRR